MSEQAPIDILVQIHECLSNISTKLDAILTTFDQNATRQSQNFDAINRGLAEIQIEIQSIHTQTIQIVENTREIMYNR